MAGRRRTHRSRPRRTGCVAAARKGGSRGAFPVRSPAETSIVKERGGEAPHDEPGEPHSPGLLPFGGGFVSCEDLFASRSLLFGPRSLLFASHSPAFEPSEGEKKRRDLHLERREGEGMSRSLGFAPSDLPFASHSPPFASHSLR